MRDDIWSVSIVLQLILRTNGFYEQEDLHAHQCDAPKNVWTVEARLIPYQPAGPAKTLQLIRRYTLNSKMCQRDLFLYYSHTEAGLIRYYS